MCGSAEILVSEMDSTSATRVWDCFGFKEEDAALCQALCLACHANVATSRGNTINLFQHLNTTEACTVCQTSQRTQDRDHLKVPPHIKAVRSLTVHFTDEDFNLNARCLQATDVPDEHTGENAAAGLREGLASWDLNEDEDVCIVTGNVSNTVLAAHLNELTGLQRFGDRLHLAISLLSCVFVCVCVCVRERECV